MRKTKKIYTYVQRLIRKCYACNGTGRLLRTIVCTHCKGEGGYYKSVKILVGEEVIG